MGCVESTASAAGIRRQQRKHGKEPKKQGKKKKNRDRFSSCSMSSASTKTLSRSRGGGSDDCDAATFHGLESVNEEGGTFSHSPSRTNDGAAPLDPSSTTNELPGERTKSRDTVRGAAPQRRGSPQESISAGPKTASLTTEPRSYSTSTGLGNVGQVSNSVESYSRRFTGTSVSCDLPKSGDPTSPPLQILPAEDNTSCSGKNPLEFSPRSQPLPSGESTPSVVSGITNESSVVVTGGGGPTGKLYGLEIDRMRLGSVSTNVTNSTVQTAGSQGTGNGDVSDRRGERGAPLHNVSNVSDLLQSSSGRDAAKMFVNGGELPPPSVPGPIDPRPQASLAGSLNKTSSMSLLPDSQRTYSLSQHRTMSVPGTSVIEPSDPAWWRAEYTPNQNAEPDIDHAELQRHFAPPSTKVIQRVQEWSDGKPSE